MYILYSKFTVFVKYFNCIFAVFLSIFTVFIDFSKINDIILKSKIIRWYYEHF